MSDRYVTIKFMFTGAHEHTRTRLARLARKNSGPVLFLSTAIHADEPNALKLFVL
ncbi:MAG: hypothetical protein ACI8VW_000105 [bacterium]|jgi:hypothetical protein